MIALGWRTGPDASKLLSELGPASVSALAGHTGESTASVSYHLSQLARFGLVEEAVGARSGQERPWRGPR